MAIAPSSVMYLDNTFYEEKMGEDPEEEKCYQVDVKAFYFKWFFKGETGKEFLDAIINTENLDIYSNEFIKIMITFLFERF